MRCCRQLPVSRASACYTRCTWPHPRKVTLVATVATGGACYPPDPPPHPGCTSDINSPAHQAPGSQPGQPTPRSRWQALQDMIRSQGPGAFLAYISISNCLSVGMLGSAWLLFTRSTGQTPLQAWPQFLACYAGAYAAQHLARPYKLAAGLAAAPLGSAAISAVQKLLRVSSRAALVVLLLLEAVLLLSCLGCVVLYASRMVAT